jgi:hypothetical protein
LTVDCAQSVAQAAGIFLSLKTVKSVGPAVIGAFCPAATVVCGPGFAVFTSALVVCLGEAGALRALILAIA